MHVAKLTKSLLPYNPKLLAVIRLRKQWIWFMDITVYLGVHLNTVSQW